MPAESLESAPVSRSLLLALGEAGLTLTLSPEAQADAPRTVTQMGRPLGNPEELWRAALEALRALAAGRRRAAIVVGDLTLPAPYDGVLQALAGQLQACGIRPSRIGFLCRPGVCGPVLGRSALRRYGEAVADYPLRNWGEEPGADEGSDALWETADVRLVVFPPLPGARAALPPGLPPELAFALAPGRGCTGTLHAVRAGPPEVVFPAEAPAAHPPSCSVHLTTGGGTPSDATLEEALLGLRFLAPPAAGERATAVLAFSGAEGLGSARFTLDCWSLLQQAAEELAAHGRLPEGAAASPLPWEPAAALATALCAWERVVLFSPGLAAHEEGEDLLARLASLPALAGRLTCVATEAELWALLQAPQGPRWRLFAEPLGWRAWVGP